MQNRYLAFFFRFELNMVVSRIGFLVIVNVEEDVVWDVRITEGFALSTLFVVFTPITLADYRSHT